SPPRGREPNGAPARESSARAWGDGKPPPRMRRLGIRASLARRFLAALEADFNDNATEVIQAVRQERPLDYLKIIISLLPDEIVNDATGEMTNAERDELVGRIRAAIAARSGRPSHKPDGEADAGGA